MSFKPKCLPTMIGSLPHTDSEVAINLIEKYFPEIPVWPQLPNRLYLEGMFFQYSEGMPGLVLDREGERIFFDTSRDICGELEVFYERCLEGDVNYFRMSEEYAEGFYCFVEKFKRAGPKSLKYLKGQITGPISFGLSVTDENKKAIIYNEEIFEAVLKCTAMRTRFMIEKLREVHPEVIIFIDEPYLSSFGSAYVNLSRDQVIRYLSEIIEAVRSCEAISGLHCCGNTDWSILMETDLDIINFDALSHFQGITLYPQHLKKFFGKGGVLAWGIVPSSLDIENESRETLFEKIEGMFDVFYRMGFKQEEVKESCLITPSCGLGSVSIDTAEKCLQKTRELSDILRKDLNSQ